MKVGIVSFEEKRFILKDIFNGKIIENNFNNHLELDKSAIWLSDLPKEELWRKGIFYVKHDKYLNISFSQLKKLIGNSLEKLLFVFEKTITLAINTYHIDLSEDSLSLAIKNGFQKTKEETIISDKIFSFIRRSYQEEVFCIEEHDYLQLLKSGYREICIKKNGILYSNDIINNIKLPNHHKYELWDTVKIEREMKKNMVDKTNLPTQEYLLNYKSESLYLVHFDKKELKNKFKSQEDILLCNDFMFTLTKRLDRNWITSTELSYLNNFFDFNIVKVLYFPEKLSHDRLNEWYQLDKMKLNDLSYFSIVLTLLMENYTLSLFEKQYTQDNQSVNILNTFVSSQEKKDLLIMSVILNANKFKVYSYGKNKINLLVDNNSDMKKLNDLIQKAGYYIF